MFEDLHNRKSTQLTIGLLIGICFGFLLQRGGVTRYDVIMGQLLLTDFTVIKVMLTAIAIGMIGIYTMKSFGLVKLHAKPGTVGSTVIGGLIFGVGFAVLGYCPGTVAGAAAQGSLDALLGGIPGIFVGVWIYSMLYPALRKNLLYYGSFGKITFPELFKIKEWIAVWIASIAILIFFLILEKKGL